MAGKADFTEAEWKTLHQGVTGAGLLVSLAHRDFTDGFGEASAMAHELSDEHLTNASQLVRELAGVRSTGFGMMSSPTKVEAETMAALAAAIPLLESKAPDELEAYRTLVLAVAQRVAESKGGVVPQETAMIGRIRTALGLEAAPA
jgi:tellurite resistance protein